MNQSAPSALAGTGAALRGLQRSAFLAVFATGFRFGGMSAWLAAVSAVLWLVVLWWAVKLVRSLPMGGPRLPAAALTLGLALTGVAAAVDSVRWSTDGFDNASWARPVGALATVPWVWLVRRLAQQSGIEPFISESARIVRRTRWLFVFVAAAVALAGVIELRNDTGAAVVPISVMVLVTFGWQVRLWIFTRDLWQAFDPPPSSLTDDAPASSASDQSPRLGPPR